MRSVLILCSPLLLASCGFLSPSNETLEESLQGAADFINGDGQSLLPEIPGKVSARAEGNILVLRIVDIPTGNHAFDEGLMRKAIRPGVCDHWENRDVIDRGGKFRIELVSDIGTVSPPVTISHC